MALPTPDPDRTCLVTGASSGIGLEIARELARRGLGLALVARRAGRLQSLAEELSAANGVRVEVIAADVSDEGSRSTIEPRVAEAGLTVDLLVNDAGVSTTGPVHRADRARELAMVRTDVEAVVDLCTVFLPGMVERGAGAILNVASTAAYQPLPGQAGYGASKAFVLSYSQALGGELRGTGVTVTVLCPGPVETDFGRTAGLSEAEAEGSLPKFMWVPAATVAKAAVDGVATGRHVVIPGAANAVAAGLAKVTPHNLVVSLLARQHPALRR